MVASRWLSYALDLKGFMCRVEVLKLYRMYIRTSRLARPDMRGMELSQLWVEVCARVSRCLCIVFVESLMIEIRKEFESRKGINDVHTIKYLLSDGKTRLNQLRDMLQLSQ